MGQFSGFPRRQLKRFSYGAFNAASGGQLRPSNFLRVWGEFGWHTIRGGLGTGQMKAKNYEHRFKYVSLNVLSFRLRFLIDQVTLIRVILIIYLNSKNKKIITSIKRFLRINYNGFLWRKYLFRKNIIIVQNIQEILRYIRKRMKFGTVISRNL